MSNKLKLSIMAAVLAISAPSFAASQTDSFEVQTVISAACIVQATDVDFGTVTPAETGFANATGTITSRCSNDVAYTLNINGGNGSILDREMDGTSGNTDVVKYNLYTDNSYANVWGDGVEGSNVGLTGVGIDQVTTVYGRFSLNQYVKPDSYKDTLTVTLTY